LGDGEEVMERLLYKTNIEGLDHFDFIFIDAAKSHYRRFWDVAEKLVKKGGLIVCDNTLMNGRTVSDKYDRLRKHRTNIAQMRDFLDYIHGLPHVDTAILPVGDGISISIVNKP
jgi:predicted O-methyltransferase YrrM